ncbi:MAG: 50S ribosomal protein L11 methyltransferase [Bacteroidales bacterium]
MNFFEITLEMPFVHDELEDILIARLSEIGFEGFWTDELLLKAYVDEELFNKEKFESIVFQYLPNNKYSINLLADKNWNEQWERSYDPVIIDNRCIIKAPFHQIEKKYSIEIVISPKMAFGTGHHPTTKLMLERLFDLDLQSKSIIDAGCGSGVLAIAAEKLGAESIIAYDIDSWSVENTRENIALNNCKKILIKKGSISELNLPSVNIILANINRNVLLTEMKHYKNHLLQDGLLILSGFVEQDVSILTDKAEAEGLNLKNAYNQDDWYCLVFKNE